MKRNHKQKSGFWGHADDVLGYADAYLDIRLQVCSISPQHKAAYSACCYHASVSDYLCSGCGHYDGPKRQCFMRELLFPSRLPLLFLPIFVFIDLILWLHADRLYKFSSNVLIILTVHLAAWLSDQFVGSNVNHKKITISLIVCMQF